jgi:hypothetical protein
MAHPAQLEELTAKHKALDRQIQEELDHPGTSDLRIAELKRQKLRLKDEMMSLEETKEN